MDIWMLVLCGDDGQFLSNPEFYDYKDEAKKARDRKPATKDGEAWDLFRCEPVY